MDERKIERAFYHDLLNLASSMRGISEVIRDVDDNTRAEMLSLLGSIAETLLETIHARRHYRSLEEKDLKLAFSTIDCEKLLKRTADIYRKHTLCQHKTIEVLPLPPSGQPPLRLFTDQDVLQGALGYGVRTALVAMKSGQTMTLGVTVDESVEPHPVLFSIAFPGTVPEEEQPTFFKKTEQGTSALTGLFPYVFHTLITQYLKGDVTWTTQGGSILLTARVQQHSDATH